MALEPLLIIGAGGFGREVYVIAAEINAARPTWDLIGFLDDDPTKLDGFTGYGPILGSIDDYARFGQPWAVCAIGDSRMRKDIVRRLVPHDPRWATLVHPDTYVAPTARIGEGTIIARDSVVSVDAVLGRHVAVNLLVMVAHDCICEDYVTLSPQVSLGGAVRLEEGAFLGLNATILPQKRMGPWSLLGAGSVATRDVPEGATMVGLPGRILPTKRRPSLDH